MSNTSQNQLKVLANYSICAFLLSTGLFALLLPTSFAAGFGMPIQPNTFAAGFVQCMGGRNLTLGILASVFAKGGDWKSVGLVALLLGVDGVVDGWVVGRYAGWVFAAPHFGDRGCGAVSGGLDGELGECCQRLICFFPRLA